MRTKSQTSIIAQKREAHEGDPKSLKRCDQCVLCCGIFSFLCTKMWDVGANLLRLIWKLHRIDSTWLIIDPTYFSRNRPKMWLPLKILLFILIPTHVAMIIWYLSQLDYFFHSMLF
jgi:hypothetical protein